MAKNPARNPARQAIRSSGKFLKLTLSGLIVSSSVVGFWWVLETNKVTESYLITKVDLSSGSPLLELDLKQAELSLFATGENYLKASQLPTGAYLIRSLSAGEVIPRSAVTTQSLDDWANIVLTPSIELSAQIRPGTKVSVWASELLDYQSFGEPFITALDAEVVGIRPPQGNFSQGLSSVELRVPVENLKALLRSISNRDAIALTSSATSLVD
jgi:hypothetical protein